MDIEWASSYYVGMSEKLRKIRAALFFDLTVTEVVLHVEINSVGRCSTEEINYEK